MTLSRLPNKKPRIHVLASKETFGLATLNKVTLLFWAVTIPMPKRGNEMSSTHPRHLHLPIHCPGVEPCHHLSEEF